MFLKRTRSRFACLRTLAPAWMAAVLLLYAAAASASARDDYDTAVEFFRKGDYEAAIAGFKSAEQKGMSSAALYYNLGSAFFKTGRYAESRQYFERVAEYPEKRPLAEFNLGMIAQKENDGRAALRHFEYAAANSSNEKLADLARAQIVGLQRSGRRWSAFLNANYGYDDNISVTPDNLALGVDDTFYSVYASADFVFLGRRKQGWLADAAYFRIDFSDTDSFDQDFYTIGVRNEHRFSSWNTTAHLKYGNSTFGDEDLQSFYKLDLVGSTPLSGLSKLILQYRFDDFTSENPTFDYLEGWRQRAQVRYYRNAERSTQQLYYEAEINDRGELVTATVSYEYSPTRHMAGGRYTHRFGDRWYLTGDLSYRVSDFPASATLDRDDTRWLFDVWLNYHLNRSVQLKGNLKHINNDSTVDIYTYDRTVVSLGLNLLF